MSEERVSALEQAIKKMIAACGKDRMSEWRAICLQDAFKVVSERDAELLELVDEWRQIARNTVDPSCAASYRACAANLVYRLTEKG